LKPIHSNIESKLIPTLDLSGYRAANTGLRLSNRRMDGWRESQTDRLKDRQIDWKTDRQTESQKDRHIVC